MEFHIVGWDSHLRSYSEQSQNKMKFFRRFFGKEDKKEDIEEKRKIKFSELEDWLQERKEKENQGGYRKAKPIIDGILQSVGKIGELIDKLDKADCPGDIPKRARKIVLSSKPAFVKGIRDSLRIIENSSKDDLNEFHRNLNSTLLSIGKVMGGQGRYLPVAFGDIIQEIAKGTKFIVAKGKELKEFIPKSSYDRLLESIEEIKKESGKLIDLDAKEKELGGRLKKADGERERLVRAMEDFEKSPEFREFQRLEQELNELNKRKKEIESKIYAILSPIKRPLKKFRKIGGERKDIKAYIDDPLQEFLSGSNLESIITEVRKAIDSGSLKIKKSELDRIVRVEENLHEFYRLKEEYSTIGSKQKEVCMRLESFPKLGKGNELRKEIEHLERELDELQREPDRVEKKRIHIQGRISALRDSVQNSLFEFQPEIEVDWDSK